MAAESGAVPSKTSPWILFARPSFRIRRAASCEAMDTKLTVMPYFFSNASLMGVTTWRTISPLYQTT